ncbi:MAG: capsular polysaccharide biosynthesis protein [Desulfovibrio sp.]|nr:capsular polysaccharide biosynthesis protein [Desulfovibrio sp.]
MSRLLRYLFRESAQKILTWLTRPLAHLARLSGPKPGSWYACFAPGILAIAGIDVLAGAPCVRLPASFLAERFLARNRDCLGVLFWGVKEAQNRPGLVSQLSKGWKRHGFFGACLGLGAWLKTLRYQRRIAFALSFAARHKLPIIRCEDGFLRSLDLGVHGAPPLSLVFDRSGIYYDATRPSDLEKLLASDQDFSELLPSARRAMDLIVRYGLSKYNHAPEAPKLAETGRRRILVLDQTRGDVSITLGLASQASFSEMLACVLRRHADCDIYLKIHPDVLSGRKQGHFVKEALPEHVQLIAYDAQPLSLLRQVDEVYTVSSQMGFEALLLGKTVHCFGLPFYAGWGLTDDRQRSPRRKRSRTLCEVFCAAYLLYARYYSPSNRCLGTLFSCLELLKTQRKVNEANRGFHACLGFRRWKHVHARAFLASTDGQVAFYQTALAAVLAAYEQGGDVVVWASKETPNCQRLCAEYGVPLRFMEDGFLRSVGLGSNFFRPGSLVVDDLGIYYNPAKPSRLERLLLTERSEDELASARQLRAELVARGISKYNVAGASDLPAIPPGRVVILVPGQVEDDASVRLGGLGIQSNAQLLACVRHNHPSAYIIYKEHPDVVSGNRQGRVPSALLAEMADAVVRTCPIEKVLPLCHEVHTLTSLTGFEALLRGIAVTTYGGPFYAGWGLTRDRCHFPRRRPLPSVDHLVAATLLLYPRYYDWQAQMPVDCAAFIDCLAKMRSNS